jgi:hypothetical protein
MKASNFNPELWVNQLISRYCVDEWRSPIPTGQLHEPSPAVLRRRARDARRLRHRIARYQFWWRVRAPLRVIGRWGGLRDDE